jgi:RNA polymerase sigma-70 factor (ECF subfamily)
VSAASADDLPDRLQAGDPDALQEVFDRHARRLILLALRHLPPGLRPKVDAEDVVQSVFRSFVRRNNAGGFQFATEDDLRGLLVVMTLRKCGKQVRRYLGPQRDVRKEATAADDDLDGEACAALAREPTPEEAAAAAELLERCLQALDERERRVLLLEMEGWTAAEIGDRVGLTRYTVEGMRKRIRKRLEHLRREPGGA